MCHGPEMPCTSTNYPSVDELFMTAAPVPGSGGNLIGPYLVVSNEPEQLTGPDIQLYKCEIPLSGDEPQRIRVFIWHTATDDGNSFHIAAKLGSGTGTVSNFVGHVEELEFTDINLVAAGICCAQAVLYDSYDSSFANVNISTNESVVYTKTIDGGKFLGAVLEFDVSISDATTLFLRTYVGSVNESVNPQDGSPERHVRGWWPYSDASFAVSGNVETNPTEPLSTGAVLCPIEETRDSSGNRIVPPELVPTVFGHRPSDTWGWPLPFQPTFPPTLSPLGGSVGLYGAIVRYVFTASNSDLKNSHAAWLEIYGRNNGGKVFGAAQITFPSGYPEWVVPPLHWVGAIGKAEGCALTHKSSGTAPVILPPNTSSQIITVKFTAGGASSLPGNLLLMALRETVP